MTYLFLFAVSLIITTLLTPLMRDGLRALGLVDHPDLHRKLHGSPVPRLGGFPISIAFFTSILLLHWAPTTLAAIFRQQAGEVYKIFLPSLLILAVGTWDDLRGTTPYVKLAVQCAAGAWLFFQGLRIEHIGVLGTPGLDLGIFSLPVTLLWIVAITNAFNLVDGLDGLASGVAFFASTTMFVVALIQKNIHLGILTASLAGATLGFLRYNFNPATVFLGDSGSMFLGFLLASFAVLWSSKTSTLVAVAAPVFALGLPVVEVVLSVFRRFVRGQPILAGDREHIHHRLLNLGLTPRRAVVVLYAVCTLFSIASLLLANWQTRDVGLVLLVLIGAGWLGVQQLGYHEFGEMTDSLRRGLFQQRRIINTHVRIRSLGTVMQQVSGLAELMAILQEIAEELGFQEVRLDLRGRRDSLPEGASALLTADCREPNSQVIQNPARFWHLDIPVGSHDDDNSRVIFSQELQEGRTPYLVHTLVEVLSQNLPQVIDRLLAAESPALPDPAVIPGAQRGAASG